MRRKISGEVWDQVDVAIAAGIGCREVARNLGLPAGTVLAHSKRKGLRQQIAAAKRATQSQQSDAITPLQSVVATMQQRGERYVQRLAGVSERVMPHLDSMEPGEILDSARNLELFDRVARRNFGLENQPPTGGVITLSVLCNQAAIKVSPES